MARTLLRPKPDAAKLNSLLAVGGVDFRKVASWDQPESDAKSPVVEATLRGGFGSRWSRLPATVQESQDVFDEHDYAFETGGRRLLLQGDAPSETRLKYELERYSILHLATHGYFQPEGMKSMWQEAKDAAGNVEMRMGEQAKRLVGKQPGLLSGLVCAGADPGADRGEQPGDDDGYLTAEEIGWLDLSGAELVVLSACETGLGRAESGEGLIGLRRTFRTAGAQTVISSLWSVRDQATAELMQAFYGNLLEKGMPRHKALREAQLEMLKSNRIKNDNAGLPSTWGAFVLSGEWR